MASASYQRHWRAENPGYDRRYREENREELRARARCYREQHYEKEVARSRNYYAKHRESEMARNRRWRQENPEKVAAMQARRAAHKRGLPDTLTPEQAEQLLAVGSAMYPGEKLHLDHIVPLSKGGGTTLANMHAIPAGLNQSKKDRLPNEVYEQVGLAI